VEVAQLGWLEREKESKSLRTDTALLSALFAEFLHNTPSDLNILFRGHRRYNRPSIEDITQKQSFSPEKNLGTTKHHIINKIMAKRKMSANKIPVTVLTGRWNNLLF
jgi:hypothetical protein